MVICKNCATIIPDGAKFCPECGAVVKTDSPAQPSVTQTGQTSGAWTDSNTVKLSEGGISGTYHFGGSGNASSGATAPPITPPSKAKKGVNPAIFVLGFLAVLLVILIGMLIGGGSKGKVDVNLGRYDCVSREALGYTDDGEGDWLELKARGKVTVFMDGDEFDGKWELDGDRIEISQGGDDFEGTLTDGVIVLTFGDLICTYMKEGAALPAEETAPALPLPEESVPEEIMVPEEETAPEEAAPEENKLNCEWWDGDWYGWWIMNNTTGEYTDLEDSCWDACAVIELDSNGEGYIELWDTDNEPGKYFAIVDVKLTESASDIGCLISTEGQMYNESILRGEWIIDPAESYVSVYGNMIAIEGYYYDSDDASNSFEYMIFLRPWGTDWEDVRNDTDNPDMPYTDMMPVNYDNWYLEYKDGKMPDSFN